MGRRRRDGRLQNACYAPALGQLEEHAQTVDEIQNDAEAEWSFIGRRGRKVNVSCLQSPALMNDAAKFDGTRFSTLADAFAAHPDWISLRQHAEKDWTQSKARPRLSVAPMMRYTDHHFRTLVRLLTKQTLLFTEMVTADDVLVAVAEGTASLQRLLSFDDSQHPIAVQLGGRDPDKLAKAAKICETFGYDEVNLNLGCPSAAVSDSNKFGAHLMLEPELASQLCASMRTACIKSAITAKHRLGVDNNDSFDDVVDFVTRLASAGVRWFIVHARKAVLGGLLTPAQNRDVPPLRYELVHELARRFPDLHFELNGGVKTLEQTLVHLEPLCQQWAPESDVNGAPSSRALSGVMIGRAAYDTPWLLADADQAIFGVPNPGRSRREVIEAYLSYAESFLSARILSLPTADRILEEEEALAGPLKNLFANEQGGTEWTAAMTELLIKRSSEYPLRPGVNALRRIVQEASLHVPNEVLDARPPSGP